MIDALLDSGADISLISDAAVQKRGIRTQPLENPLYVVLADRTRVLATSCVPSLPLARDGWTDEVRCVVVPSLTQPLFLGRDWLQKWNPVINWVSGELSLAEAARPWRPKGDVHECMQPGDQSGEQTEVSPSAYRKIVRRAGRQQAAVSAATLLMVVRAAEASVAPSAPPAPPSEEVKALMADFPKVFEEAEGVEKDPPVRHPIRLEDGAKPSHVKPYRFTETQRNEMKEQVIQLLQKGWIRPSSSPWGAPVLLVPKKDGTWRFCVDFRNLNAVTVRDSFPLPRIDDLLHKVGQAKVFSKMDMQSGFHQVPMEETAIETTAFSLPEPVEGSAHYEWIVMPFGLMNAPSTFQRLISKVLVGCEPFTAAYIDDVLVFSRDRDEHQQHLTKVLQCLARHNL